MAPGSLFGGQNGNANPTHPLVTDEAPQPKENAGDSNIVEVAKGGDVVVCVEHETKSIKHAARFRVSTPALKQHSKYFERLLQPGRFGEANRIEDQHKQLKERYQSLADVPIEELPSVSVQDIGRISSVKSISTLVADFFHILHGQDLETLPPVANLANLAVVSDRFDALEVVKSCMGRKKTIRTLEGKTTPKVDNALSEEKVRQRLLVAVMLDYPPWVEKYSARMIIKGWVGREVDLSEALWWDLPQRVEDELALRRDCVLETIQSLQSCFLRLYASRDRQCRLGYDSSPQCDSFQLGEMVRFFTKMGMLQLQGAIFDVSEPPEPYSGDINNLIDTLKQVPEYQVDRNHTHCGIRTRLLPLLDVVQDCLHHIGICFHCWTEDRAGYAWIDAKRPLLWKRGDHIPRAQGHGNRHVDIRSMFMAGERKWT
ncbi:hypothetical protein KC330_g1036 [Hortaea werneckii]|nr:hypothetical protein KC330_g1036 [Hortaea werneckii]